MNSQQKDNGKEVESEATEVNNGDELVLFSHSWIYKKEAEALQELKNTINFPIILNPINSQHAHPASSFSENHHVVKVKLSGSYIHEIPESIGNLKYLRYLRLAYNPLQTF